MTNLYNSEWIQTIVIGGGQAGLAVGYHLAQQGLPFQILDANPQIGDAWRNRWDSLRLFNPARYAGLPGLPFPGPRRPISHQGPGGPLPRRLRRPASICPSGTESRSIASGARTAAS